MFIKVKYHRSLNKPDYVTCIDRLEIIPDGLIVHFYHFKEGKEKTFLLNRNEVRYVSVVDEGMRYRIQLAGSCYDDF